MSSAHRRRAGHGAHEEEGGMERWLLTYADMITLLLALFVVLFALSSISVQKFLEFRLGLTQTFNPSAIVKPGSNGLLSATSLVQQSSANASQIAPRSSSLPPPDAAQLRRVAAAIQSALVTRNLSDAATVTVTTKGVIVQVLADKAFFRSDSAALGAIGNAVVDTIATVVRAQPNNIVVEGYTDNQPITGGPYNSNFELSAVRAADVANRLNVVDGISQNRISAQGYGPTHPVAPNLTPADRSANRRIDVVILSRQEAP